MVSTTVMVCVALFVFLQRSEAVHMRVMRLVQPITLVEELRVTVTTPSQLYTALTVLGGGTSLRHWREALGGTPLSTGGMVSTTVMVCVALFVFRQRSEAVHVRVMRL